jgi:hypothetical protein
MQQRTIGGVVPMAVMRLHWNADMLAGRNATVVVVMQRQQQYQRPVTAQNHERDAAAGTEG